jgi:uncharacterized protein YdaU (DUF1376 family)
MGYALRFHLQSFFRRGTSNSHLRVKKELRREPDGAAWEERPERVMRRGKREEEVHRFS